MITVIVLKHHEEIRGFQLEGHAEFAAKGKDIVCSAVSALYISMINSLQAFTEDVFEVRHDEKQDFQNVFFQNPLSEKAKLLAESFLLGIKGIAKEYGSRYIEIKDQEV